MAGKIKTGEILADSSNGNVTDLSKNIQKLKFIFFFF